jgi:hypothetical protein
MTCCARSVANRSRNERVESWKSKEAERAALGHVGERLHRAAEVCHQGARFEALVGQHLFLSESWLADLDQCRDAVLPRTHWKASPRWPRPIAGRVAIGVPGSLVGDVRLDPEMWSTP